MGKTTHFQLNKQVCYTFSSEGRVNQQVQYYEIKLKNLFFGVLNFSFSLGLLFILYCTFFIKSSSISLKSVPLGIYCLTSLFMFSIAPFCHEAYESAKKTFVPSALAIFLWHANSVPLSVEW